MLIFASTYAKSKADSPMESRQTQPHNLSFFSLDTLIPIWESIIHIFSDESHCVFHTKCSHPLWQNSVTFSSIYSFQNEWRHQSKKVTWGWCLHAFQKEEQWKFQDFAITHLMRKTLGFNTTNLDDRFSKWG